MSRPVVATMTFALLFTSAALGQEPLTLRAAMERTQANNPGLAAAHESIVQARITRDSAFSLIQPQVRLGAMYRINDREIVLDFEDSMGTLGDAFEGIYTNIGLIYGELFESGLIDAQDCDDIAVANGYADCAELTAAMANGTSSNTNTDSGDPIVVQPQSQLFVSGEVQWPLSPRVIPLAQAGKAQITVAEASYAMATADVLVAVVDTYAFAYELQQTVALLDEQTELLATHRAHVQLLVENGVATPDAVLRMDLEAARLAQQRQHVAQASRAARRALAVLFGSDQPDFGALAALDEIAPASPKSTNDNHPALTSADAMSQAARAMKTDAALQFLPQFAITGSWSWTNVDMGFDGRRSNAYVGFGLSVPIWDGGQSMNRAREAASRWRQANLNASMTQQRISMEMDNAVDALDSASLALPTASLERDLARETHRQVSLLFDEGHATEVDVLDALTALRAAEINYLHAHVEHHRATAALLRAQGQLHGADDLLR